ncbi:hypothetical protein DFO73_110200 [Cytobacillus oceanisediminis]|uniref:Tetratricopeptide repeat protein n=1 Tax=Cytobacillus oceanisediminis TaxID=665099 RepID=A0A2V2ZQN7_9BACI|nr:tetratricopeptide repeat protein [Cytobacillus oceanisediminis]PWW26626.1 hypothetical protein DFO73_110200 [Cytobacillus oceanisediminis]
MNTLYQQKEQANELRKNGLLEEALPLYQTLWESAQDKFNGAGLLHCLRKLRRFEEALPLAKELEKIHIGFDWCRREIIWTYIGGYLNRLTEKDTMGKTLNIANHILTLQPDDLAMQKVVFAVLKKAKQLKKMDIACEWVDKITPENIDSTPIKTERGDTGWSYQTIWYLHKIRCLIHQNLFKDAIDMVDFVLQNPNEKEKYFKRLKATALLKQGDIDEAEAILQFLCKARRVEWWLLYDYAMLISEKGEKTVALDYMYKAASSEKRLEGILGLILDAAKLSKELKRMEESFFHFQLVKLIREKNGWSIQEEILKELQELSTQHDFNSSVTFPEALKKCRSYWGANLTEPSRSMEKKNKRTSLSGVVKLAKEGAPYCFIHCNKESFYCLISDFPASPVDGMSVKFDAIQSYDKKKQKESWKAVNIISN